MHGIVERVSLNKSSFSSLAEYAPLDIILKLPESAWNSTSWSFGIVWVASKFWTAMTAQIVFHLALTVALCKSELIRLVDIKCWNRLVLTRSVERDAHLCSSPGRRKHQVSGPDVHANQNPKKRPLIMKHISMKRGRNQRAVAIIVKVACAECVLYCTLVNANTPRHGWKE